jgi:predicted secreted protein
MASDKSMVEKALSGLLEKANSSHLTPLRLKDWRKVIEWRVDDRSFFWASDGSQFCVSSPFPADFVLKLSALTLNYVAEGKLPFFIGLWGTGDIAFEGSFSDAYRLGYVFLSDKRKRRVIFISHCWLNINTRFPEGSAFEGANVPLIKTLLDSGLGIIQMPCPEYECLGLEKWGYGEVIKDDLRACFRKQAEVVLKQIKNYLALGFEIVGILGMNPSPSCGVHVAKGKGTMLGTSRDTSEQPEPGIFIEELQNLLAGEGINDIRFFAVRRTLIGESGLDEKIEAVRTFIQS